MGKAVKLPKTKCCVSTTRCDRCPIRLLKEGSLPSGYTVKKRKLVKVSATGKVKKVDKKDLAKSVKKSAKKASKAA